MSKVLGIWLWFCLGQGPCRDDLVKNFVLRSSGVIWCLSPADTVLEGKCRGRSQAPGRTLQTTPSLRRAVLQPQDKKYPQPAKARKNFFWILAKSLGGELGSAKISNPTLGPQWWEYILVTCFVVICYDHHRKWIKGPNTGCEVCAGSPGKKKFWDLQWSRLKNI